MKTRYTHAAVFISVYDRVEHYKNSLISLSKCIGADKTIVYVSSDGAASEDAEKKVREIREFTVSFKGFKAIEPCFSDKNTKGRIIHESREYVYSKHDRLIRSEDDNIFSSDFLDFVNKGLEVYQDREDIFSISGYQYPVEIPPNYLHDIYLWQGCSAWGVGIWREKYRRMTQDIDLGLDTVRNTLKEYNNVYKLNSVANHYIPALLLMIEQNRIHGDGYICLYQFLNNIYSVFPVISRVRNMGHDGSGTGCGYMENDIYAKQEIYSGDVGRCMMPTDLHPNEEINKVLADHFRTPFKSKIKTMGKIALLNAGLWP